jgi:hypothetical protein
MRTSYKTSPPKPPIPPYNLPQGSLLLSLMIGVGCCLLCILEKLLKLLLLRFWLLYFGVCVFITAGPITKLFAGGEEERFRRWRRGRIRECAFP